MRVFGHPLHAILVHFPLAFLTFSPVWQAVAIWLEQPEWWVFNFWTLVVGLVTAFLAMIPGFVDYARLPREHAAEKPATWHLVSMLIAAGLFIAAVVIQGGPQAPAAGRHYVIFGLSLLGMLIASGGAWLGGELVFRHGIGRIDKDSRDGGGDAYPLP